jgi:hypothetical protein
VAVAAHAWDAAGAVQAGLRAAWVASKEGRRHPALPPANVQAPDLEGAARAVLAHAG